MLQFHEDLVIRLQYGGPDVKTQQHIVKHAHPLPALILLGMMVLGQPAPVCQI